jgi:hypothetical protein
MALLAGSGVRLTMSRMQKHLAPILLALIAAMPLAACSSNNYGGGGSGYGGTGGNINTQSGANAHFLASDPTVIEVTVRDPLPAAQVFLIDPSGQQTAAHDIQRDRRTYQSDGGARPSVGLGVGGGSWGGGSGVSSGIGIGIPLFSSGGSGRSSEVIDSTAKVRISNPTLYRTTWQSWKLRVELGDGANKRVIETLPPKPL